MKIIREVISWENETDDCDKLYNKLDKKGSIEPIKISGVFSNNAIYEIEIADNSNITMVITDDAGKSNYEMFSLSYFYNLMQSYSIEVNDTQYIMRFNIDNFLKYKGISRQTLLVRINSDYFVEMLVSYDFNNKSELTDAIYLFLSNSILISSRDYNLMKEKLEYYGYDRDFMFEIEYVDKLDMNKKYDNKVYFDMLLYKALFEVNEVTFFHQYGSPDKREAIRQVFENYLDTL